MPGRTKMTPIKVNGGEVFDLAQQRAKALYDWRFAQLVMECGLSPDDAESVIEAIGVCGTWHDVLLLVKAGCPAAVAAEIVR